MVNAKAPANVIPEFCAIAPASTTPAAIPSGILWSVTANTIIVEFFNFAFIPSGLSVFKCKCGIIWSNASKNTIPKLNPIAVGSHLISPCSSAISIDGIISDHIDAAIITPAAKPSRSLSTFLFTSFFIKNTIAEPKVVPKKGIKSPIATFVIFTPSSHFIYFSKLES